MKLTKLSAALWHGRHEELVGRCRLVPAVAWLRAGTASQLIASVRWTQGRPRRTWRTRPVRRAEGTRGVLLEQCMDLRAERWLAPLAGESKGRTAPHGTGGNVSGAVRPLHALGVERHLRAPAGPRERGTYCSGTCSVRTDPRREWGATEQGVQADEARVVLERGLVVGAYRGSAVIVRGPRGALASQLNAGVRRTGTAAGLAMLAWVAAAAADPCAGVGTGLHVNADTHRLYVCEAGQKKAVYGVALGSGGVDKRVQGDAKVPLGTYSLGRPRASSKFHIFIPVGYPTTSQRRAGYTGGDVGVHGPSRLAQGSFSTLVDWTLGCTAVGTDREIDAIASWVRKQPHARIVITAK